MTGQKNKLMIIGIDSLDYRVLSALKAELPNFSRLMEASPTQTAESVFPVDTIPAWASISTGLNPGNHGLLYTFDVFDPNLSDLQKLDSHSIKGKTFWDRANKAGLRSVVLFPQLIFPAWETSGIMVCKSPHDRRLDWIKTEIDLDTYPAEAKAKYHIPEKIEGLWGGFPGDSRLLEWAELGKQIVEQEKNLGLEVCKNEQWDLFFIYFNLLDIVQHRLWRYYDPQDPTYPGETAFRQIIPEYYRMFDRIVGEFIGLYPDVATLVLSDHGHGIRPVKTVNVNEYLRRKGLVVSSKKNRTIMSHARNLALETANRLHIEQVLIKLVTKNKSLTKASKSVYSSSGSIDRTKSMAYLSNFAGIKSYPHGGIEIRRDGMSPDAYRQTCETIIKLLREDVNAPDGTPLITWAKKREDLYKGQYTEKLYPDIVFRLKDDYGVGWDVGGGLTGKAYDHNVASGGHRKETVLLLRNVDRAVKAKTINIPDIAPTITDLLGIEWVLPGPDGKSIFAE